MEQKNFYDFSGTLTVKELCTVLKISRGIAYALIRSGEIKSLRVRRSIRIPLVYLTEYIEQNTHAKKDIL